MITIAIALILLITTFLLYRKFSPSLGRSPSQICHICEDKVNTPIFYNGYCFCKKHFEDYSQKNWKQLQSCVTSINEPLIGVRLYELKRSLISNDLPCYITCEYQDSGEEVLTTMRLYVKCEDEERARSLSSSLGY